MTATRRTCLGLCATAPLIIYLLEPIRVISVRMLHLIPKYAPPLEPQYNTPPFHYHLFRFLDLAFPLGATLAYALGIRALFCRLRNGGEFQEIRATWLLFILSGTSYLIPMFILYLPVSVQISSLVIAAGSLAILARLKEAP